MNLNGFLIMDGAGDQILADASGQSVAFLCEDCRHPILASSQENERGSDEKSPSLCPGCGLGYFLDVRENTQKLYIHELKSQA